MKKPRLLQTEENGVMNTMVLMCATFAAALAFGAGAANAGCVTKGAVATSSSAELGQVVCARNNGAVGELGSLARLCRDGQRRWLSGHEQALSLHRRWRHDDVPRPRDLLHEVVEDQFCNSTAPVELRGRRFVVGRRVVGRSHIAASQWRSPFRGLYPSHQLRLTRTPPGAMCGQSAARPRS